MSLPGGWVAATRITRPVNCLLAAASVPVGGLLAGGAPAVAWIAASAAAWMVAAGGYAVNDYFDVATDRLVKPWRPLAGGALTPRAALGLALACWAAAAAAAAWCGWTCLGFWAVWAPLLGLYSWKAKGWGLAGHLLVSAVAASGFLLGAAVAGSMRAGLAPAAVAGSVHLARELAKGVADARGDAAAGIRTLAVRAGLRRALEAAVACAVAAAGLSLVPYLLSAYGTGYLVIIVAGAYPVLGACCFRIIGALRTEGADLEAAGRGGARLLKAVMPVGLAAFLAAGV